MSSSESRQMSLCVFLSTAGYHSGAWRRPGSRSDELLTVSIAVDMTRLAEQAKLDAVFIADSLGIDSELRKAPRQTELEPITLLSALAMATHRIGLIGTISTTFTEPFNLSRYLSSLDHISRGRAGWNIVTSTGGEHNFGGTLPPHDERYTRADEYLEVVKALWDSWDDDAVVNDAKAGSWCRADRIHRIDHHGPHYDVVGPSHMPRSPQGWPVLVQAGSSAEGMNFAATHAEVVFAAQPGLASAQSFYRALRDAAVARGRSTDDVRILPGFVPIIGSTEREAHELADELLEYVDIETGLIKLGSYMPGVDFRGLDLDEPIPVGQILEVDEVERARSRFEIFRELAVEQRQTVRQLVHGIARSIGHKSSVGTPEQLADEMETWFRNGACDGFNLQLAHVPGSMTAIAEGLVPELRKRGLFRREYEGETLRDHLGLSRPPDRSGGRVAQSV